MHQRKTREYRRQGKYLERNTNGLPPFETVKEVSQRPVVIAQGALAEVGRRGATGGRRVGYGGDQSD